MRRWNPVSFCFCLVAGIVVALAVPAIPRQSAAEIAKTPPPRIPEHVLTAKAAALCGMLVNRAEPVTISLSPRPIRERNGRVSNSYDVTCVNGKREVICFFCWDAGDGSLMIYSRNEVASLAVEGDVDSRRAIDTALSWLTAADLRDSPPRWRTTSADARTPLRWIVRAESGSRKAYVFVDRRSGAVVSMTTWSDWPEGTGPSTRGGRTTTPRRIYG